MNIISKKGKKKGGKMCGAGKWSITAGCGKGRKCSVTIYVLPQGSTSEYFNEYTASRIETMRQDADSR